MDSGTKATASDLDTESSEGTEDDSDKDSMPDLESDGDAPLATVTPVQKFVPPIDLEEAYNTIDFTKEDQGTDSDTSKKTGITQISYQPKAANIIITQDQFERIMRKHGKPILGLTREDKEKAILDLKHHFRWGRTGENLKIRIVESGTKQRKQMNIKIKRAQSNVPANQPLGNHSMTPWSLARRSNNLRDYRQPYLFTAVI